MSFGDIMYMSLFISSVTPYLYSFTLTLCAPYYLHDPYV